MSNTNTGGPAFPSGLIDPSTPEDAVQPLHNGMTLRDHFAGLAMQGLLSDPNIKARPLDFAIRAYAMADALIEYRNKEQ